ncbi:MAG: TetR/AcrR family transcriptional regulator [Nonomuraea sp.]|nr:TetR/AcrR family transcriptional regulator [Nonomuraea sp.]
MAKVERGRPRDPGNDAAILEAALDLLIERGAAGTSVEAVAQRAGVAKLTVYRRWSTKDDLLMAALEHARAPEPVDAATIGDLVRHTAEQLGDPRFRALMARVIGASIDNPDLVRAYSDRHLRPRLEAVRRVAAAEGLDPDAVTDVLSSAIGFVLLRQEPVTAAEIEERLLRLVRALGRSTP